MMWQTVLAWSTVRALILATVSLPIAIRIWHLLSALKSTKWIQVVAVAAVLPLLVPALLTGFTYRLTAASLIHSPGATELLYAGLLLARAVALQVIVFAVLSASSVSTDELYSWQLLRNRNHRWLRNWIALLVTGPYRAPLVAWIGAVLICFQEFEIAALLQVDRHPIAFSVWLFDAHANGEPLHHSLALAAPAVIVQASLLAPALIIWTRGAAGTTAANSPESHARLLRFSGSVVVGALFVGVGLLVTVARPVALHMHQCVTGLKTIFADGTFSRYLIQILQTLAVASTAAVCAVAVIAVIRHTRIAGLMIAALLPGLCGPLVLSLVLLAIFQVWPFQLVYDTPLPLIVGLVLLLLPAAALTCTLLEVHSSPTAEHSAKLLRQANDDRTSRAAQLLWTLRHRRTLIVVAVLTHLGFWDVTTASILRPIQFGHIVTRLYGEMHFSRGESLIAIATLAVVVPLAMIFLCGCVWRYGIRHSGLGR